MRWYLLKWIYDRTSFKTKGIFYVVILIMVIFLSVSLLVLSSAKKNLKNQLQTFHEGIAARLAIDASDAFISKDFGSLLTRIEQLRKASQIKGATVIDLNGVVVSSEDLRKLGTIDDELLRLLESYKKKHFITKLDGKIFMPVEVDGDLFGFMEVVFDWEKEQQNLNKEFKNTVRHLIYLAIVITALGICGAFVVSSLLTKPVVDLTKEIENFERELISSTKGEISSPLRDETIYLREAFHRMIQSLKKYLSEYKRISEERQRLSCLATVGEVSAQIAHEIRNSMHAIKAAIGGIEETGYNGNIKEYIEIIKEEAADMSATMEEFLRFSKMPSPVLKECRIEEVIDRVIELLEPDLEEAGVKVIKKKDIQLPLLKGDPALLKQAFMNLFMNSIQAMPTGGKIIIDFRINEHWLDVSFKDTGPGIPQELKDKIFQPFFTTKTDGIGLGLTTVYKIVIAHYGQIYLLDSEVGANFLIRLPLGEQRLTFMEDI